MSDIRAGAVGGLQRQSRELYLKNLTAIGSHSDNAMNKIQSLQEEANSIEDAGGADLGCQITMNSIIPCQLGGMIHF